MNSNFFKTIKLGLSTFSLIFIANTNSFAQKVSDIQEGSLRAPTVKVDGKLTEWDAPLKANNKSTSLTYSLANDSKNLYLVIQSKDLANNNKIMLGGITFTIKPDGKKKVKGGFALTYPIINRVRRQNNQGGGGNRTPGQGGGGFGQGQQRTQAQRDSMQLAQGKTQLAAAKDIKVFGFKDITDSLISVYNEFGIKAAANLNEEGVFTYELSIPLSQLQMSAENNKEFAYNIKLNGLQLNFGGGDRQGGGGGRPSVVVSGGGGGFGGGNPTMMALMSPTDLWGKYTLAKK